MLFILFTYLFLLASQKKKKYNNALLLLNLLNLIITYLFICLFWLVWEEHINSHFLCGLSYNLVKICVEVVIMANR